MEHHYSPRGFTTKQVRQKINSYFSFANERREQTRYSGFTLIELLVVLGIITVITAVTITSQASFDKTLVLSNTAYDIGLAIRSAENFGLGSRAVGSIGNAGYGVHFDKNTKNYFILFADIYPPVGDPGPFCHQSIGDPNGPGAIPGNCIYTASQDARINSFLLGNGITVSNFCAGFNTTWYCASSGDIDTLDIVFARPNAAASINVDGLLSSPPIYTNACITATSPQGTSRYISVALSGQITANASSCP
jgi:prepilin-type N-terminal cleavage/methylation domain-containing protein